MSIGVNLDVTYLEGRHLLQSLRRRNIEVIETIILEYLRKEYDILMLDSE